MSPFGFACIANRIDPRGRPVVELLEHQAARPIAHNKGARHCGLLRIRQGEEDAVVEVDGRELLEAVIEARQLAGLKPGQRILRPENGTGVFSVPGEETGLDDDVFALARAGKLERDRGEEAVLHGQRIRRERGAAGSADGVGEGPVAGKDGSSLHNGPVLAAEDGTAFQDGLPRGLIGGKGHHEGDVGAVGLRARRDAAAERGRRAGGCRSGRRGGRRGERARWRPAPVRRGRSPRSAACATARARSPPKTAADSP